MPPRKPAVSEIQLAANRCSSPLIRYPTQAECHYRRAIEEFERLKALRQELPNEAILDLNPNQTQPLTPHENGPISPGNPAVGDGGGGPPPKALRQELPNEAILDPNPNQTQPLAPHEDEPTERLENPLPAVQAGRLLPAQLRASAYRQ